MIFVEPWIYIPQIQPDDVDILCASAKPDSFLTSESSLMSGSIALRLLARDLLTYSMRLTGISLSQWRPASFVVLTAGLESAPGSNRIPFLVLLYFFRSLL